MKICPNNGHINRKSQRWVYYYQNALNPNANFFKIKP